MFHRIAALLLCGLSLDARVTRIVVEHRESPAFGARSYGKAGQVELLSRHPHVAKFYAAPQQEGGAGATIVELRD